MRRSTFVTKAISLALNACLVLSPLLYARDASYAAGPADGDGIAWSAEFEPMAMRAWGYSPDVLSTFEAFAPAIGAQEPKVTFKTFDNDVTKWNVGYRGEVQGMKNRWGVGAAGFQFNTQSKFERASVLTGDDEIEPGDPFGSGFMSAAVNSIAIADTPFADGAMGLFRNEGAPFYAIEDDDFDGTRQDFSARSQLDVWSADIYGFHRVVDKETLSVDVRLGAKLGSLDVATDTDHSLAPCGDSCHVGMRLDTSAKSKVLAGPYLAAAATARFGRVRVEGQVAQSVLFGDVDYRTVGESYWNDGGESSFSRKIVDKSKSVTMPVTEVDLKVLYDLNEFFSAGVGVYAGVWWNAKVPRNTDPGSVELGGDPFDLEFFPTAAQGDLDEEHIVFMGILATLQLRFFGP